MKKIFRKLACCSFLSIASIGCFDAEARVTKEVAEAVLPYLMEAAGIEGDQHSDSTRMANKAEYENNKIQAILDMIYTDEGQQQMVKWVQTGEFPQKLDGAGFKSAETYKDKAYRDASLASLFPCSTGTFTSFANHESRMGKHVLSSTAKTVDMLATLLSPKIYYKKMSTFDEALYNISLQQQEHRIDVMLSKIIFVLDICDTETQIISTVNKAQIKVPSTKYGGSSNEYRCRPVSAILANNGGDCVETLYRHLINIAIQTSDNKLQIARLPVPLRKYFDPKLQQTEITPSNSQAGLTSIEKHEKWNECLIEISSGIINCSIGSLCNIAKMLDYIANYSNDRVINNLKASEKKKLCKLLEDAMNSLDGNKKTGDDASSRFEVLPSEHDENISWCSTIITINDKIMKRNIRIGICEKVDQNYGHAEILRITPIK